MRGLQYTDSEWSAREITWFDLLTKTVSRNELQNLKVYANNAAAIAGGLKVGDPYRTATGQVMVVY